MMSNDEKKHTHLFSFQRLNKYFLIPFFIPIICFSTKLFSETMKTDNRKKNIKDITYDNVHTFVFLYQIIQSICLILGGLLYFVSVYKSESKIYTNELNINGEPAYNEKNKNDNIIRKIKTNRDNHYDVKKIIIVIFMPLLLIIYNMGIAYGVGHQELEKRVYFLLFIILINVFILKQEIYRHQKLALVMSLIGIIPIYISFGLYLNLYTYNIFYDILLLVGSLFYSIYLVLIKYITLNKRMSVFLLLLFQGLLSFVYTISIFIGISFIKKGDFTYIMNIFECSDINYVCISYFYFNIIIYFILNTVLQVLIFFVVYHFSPELFAISDIWDPFSDFIFITIINDEKNWLKILLNVIGYLIIGIAAFIYNEIIVCNFCGLNENTREEIHRKACDEINDRYYGDSFSINDNYNMRNFSEQYSVEDSASLELPTGN